MRHLNLGYLFRCQCVKHMRQKNYILFFSFIFLPPILLCQFNLAKVWFPTSQRPFLRVFWMVFGWIRKLSPSIMVIENPNWSFRDSKEGIDCVQKMYQHFYYYLPEVSYIVFFLCLLWFSDISISISILQQICYNKKTIVSQVKDLV